MHKFTSGNSTTGAGARDENTALMDTASGYTLLHLFSDAIHQLQQLHNQIAKDKQKKVNQCLRGKSTGRRKSCTNQPLKRTKKQTIADQITNLQHELAANLEVKDTVSCMGIYNFNRRHIREMMPETFYCTRETKKGGTYTGLNTMNSSSQTQKKS